jgi:hypothetical protein
MSTQNLNVSGQDMLLLDNSTSYFQNLGYTRTSNFQFKLKQLDPQNVPRFGATTTFKIQKQDHLLGNVDLQLRLKLPDANDGAYGEVPHFLTNKFGLAMIERVRFLVGSNLIQEIDGEWLDLENTLYRSPEQQYVDIVGDARKRSDVQNHPLPISTNLSTAIDGAFAVSADRGLYVASEKDEYYGTVAPLMPRTKRDNTVQGRTRAAPWKLAGASVVAAASIPDLVPEPLAMPAYTGAKRVQHAHEAVVANRSTLAGATLSKSVHGTEFLGNPQYVNVTVPLGLFFSKHPSCTCRSWRSRARRRSRSRCACATCRR